MSDLSVMPTETKYYQVLNLGAGVQSTALYLMFMRGLISGVTLDVSVFADTQEEPQAVYQHLEWLRSLGGPQILVGTAGKLGKDLVQGRNSTGQRFASIPAYTEATGHIGMLRRQCSKEYKVEVIQRVIRYQLLGLKRGQRVPRSVKVMQYIGISLDEAGRARRMVANPAWKAPWFELRFPLIERNMTRTDCERWLYEVACVPHKVPRSACVFCPYHTDSEWVNIQQNPQDWQRAIEIDEALRQPGVVLNRRLDSKLFLHRTCKPLKEIEFAPKVGLREVQLALNFTRECLGVCGL